MAIISLLIENLYYVPSSTADQWVSKMKAVLYLKYVLILLENKIRDTFNTLLCSLLCSLLFIVFSYFASWTNLFNSLLFDVKDDWKLIGTLRVYLPVADLFAFAI